jgi:hypothetical protein
MVQLAPLLAPSLSSRNTHTHLATIHFSEKGRPTMTKKKPASSPESTMKAKETSASPEGKKKRDWYEIEGLFDDKKRQKQIDAADLAAEEQERQEQRSKNRKKKAPMQAGWEDDGLGGKYNNEGYTGRVEDGVKVFKAHILRKPNAGQSADCPFDCKCCFI